MEERIAVTLDFTKCKYIMEVFKEMRTKMEWEDWYGENLSALKDILTGMPFKGNDITILRPKHFTGIPYNNNDSFTEYVDKICAIFEESQGHFFADIMVKIVYTDEASGDISPYLI